VGVYEVGQFSYWQLLPRLVVPAIILTLSLWVGAAFPETALSTRRTANRFGFAVFLALIATFIAAFYPHGGISNPVAATDSSKATSPASAPETGSSSGAMRQGRGLRLTRRSRRETSRTCK